MSNVSFDQIEVGQVLKFEPAKYSHVKQPYFVEVIDKDTDSFTTSIPGEHSLKIDEFNRCYHMPRISVVGSKTEFEHLLSNQPLN